MKLAELSQSQRAQVERTKQVVAELHALLPAWELVVWTAGNVSERVPGTDLFVIKASGVPYEGMEAAHMVVCDLQGQLLDDDASGLVPSSDTAAHAYVYRHMPEVGGVAHTHSSYATAWAAIGEPIPCCLTMMADEFGGDIPLGPLAIIGDDSIGRGIVETLRNCHSPAVLMANHGPFTVGKDGRSAVKAAVMCEEVARTAYLARTLGEIKRIPDDMIKRLNDRYQNVYGQH